MLSLTSVICGVIVSVKELFDQLTTRQDVVLSDEVEIGLQSFLALSYKLSIHISNQLLRGKRETEARSLSNREINDENQLVSSGRLCSGEGWSSGNLVRKTSAKRHANNILFLSFFVKYHRLAFFSNMKHTMAKQNTNMSSMTTLIIKLTNRLLFNISKSLYRLMT